MKILVIRPQPGADATAKRIRATGLEPVVIPLFAIEPLAAPSFVSSEFDAMLLTSGNAVRAAKKAVLSCGGLPIYAVGSVTAAALEHIGVQADYAGDEGVDRLLTVAERCGHKRLLWLAGEDHSDPELPENIELAVIIVYRSAPLPPRPDFARIVSECDAVMLHSARAAAHFAQLCDELEIPRQLVRIAAFSRTVADNAGQGWADIIVAPAPNDTLLLSEMQRHFTTVSRDP